MLLMKRGACSMAQSQQSVGSSVTTSTSLLGRLPWHKMSTETALQLGHSRVLFSLILWRLCFKRQSWQKMCWHGSVVSIVPRSVSRRLNSFKHCRKNGLHFYPIPFAECSSGRAIHRQVWWPDDGQCSKQCTCTRDIRFPLSDAHFLELSFL